MANESETDEPATVCPAMQQRVLAFDWTRTSWGPRAGWPAELRTLVDLVLAARSPQFLVWGPDRAWLCNDAMWPLCGAAADFASPPPDGWAPGWRALAAHLARAEAGEAVWAPGLAPKLAPDLPRAGGTEPSVLDLALTPVRDGTGRLAGVMGHCSDGAVPVRSPEAERAARQRRQFAQSPNFVITTIGPDHVVDFVNEKHREVFDSAGWVGRPIREAAPDLEGQGLFESLDQVYASGVAQQAYRAEARLPATSTRAARQVFTNFVYAPTLDDDGRVVGLFVAGSDVTDAVMADLALRAGDLRQRVLVDLAERIRDLDDPANISYAAAEVLGRALCVSRAGYGTVDTRAETILIERDWNAPGIKTIAGVLHFRDYGSYIEDLKRGATVVVFDAYADRRTAATADSLKAISAQSFVNMPVTEHEGFVALLYLNHAEARTWTTEELALIREVAERTRSVVERRRAEMDLRALAASLEQQVRDRTEERDRVWRNSRDLLVVIGADGIFRAVNPAWTRILGHATSEVVGRSFLDFIWKEDAALTQGGLDAAASERDLTNFENRYTRVDGTPRWISWHTAAEGDLVLAYGRDITDQKEAARELAAAQDALRQSAKMEAVGQLTGGIAHDFNNLLAAISGSLELLNKRVAEGRLSGVERFVATAQGAARRAAALTHRLLAFSRQQTLDPRPTEVNRLIGGMEDLIRRSVGPNVAVEVVGAGGLWLTKVDPSQLENALLNLCINARDAMSPGGGRLTIETANKWLDDRAAKERDLVPGQYLSVCITDTGAGMPPEVIARAFDPFFTTKPLGEGTGLGLSMVYGFVRQSGGQVRVYSEVGRGTTMCLYLPRFIGEVESPQMPSVDAAGEGDGETVLVVDDEPSIRMLIVDVLEEAGYVAMEASDGAKALRILQSSARVDLLITDVGLPGGMNGRQVADAARVLRPGLKVLFITGFAENAVVGNGHLEPGMQILTKPFEMSTLATRIRDLIEH